MPLSAGPPRPGDRRSAPGAGRSKLRPGGRPPVWPLTRPTPQGPQPSPPKGPLNASTCAFPVAGRGNYRHGDLASRPTGPSTRLRPMLALGSETRSTRRRSRLRGDAPGCPAGSSITGCRLNGAISTIVRLSPRLGRVTGRASHQEVHLGASEAAESCHHHEAAQRRGFPYLQSLRIPETNTCAKWMSAPR